MNDSHVIYMCLNVRSNILLKAIDKNVKNHQHIVTCVCLCHIISLYVSFPWQNYFGDPWNVLDFVIVIGSLVDIVAGRLLVSHYGENMFYLMIVCHLVLLFIYRIFMLTPPFNPLLPTHAHFITFSFILITVDF